MLSANQPPFLSNRHNVRRHVSVLARRFSNELRPTRVYHAVSSCLVLATRTYQRLVPGAAKIRLRAPEPGIDLRDKQIIAHLLGVLGHLFVLQHLLRKWTERWHCEHLLDEPYPLAGTRIFLVFRHLPPLRRLSNAAACDVDEYAEIRCIAMEATAVEHARERVELIGRGRP